jgi:hypothetical protein
MGISKEGSEHCFRYQYHKKSRGLQSVERACWVIPVLGELFPTNEPSPLPSRPSNCDKTPPEVSPGVGFISPFSGGFASMLGVIFASDSF